MVDHLFSALYSESYALNVHSVFEFDAEFMT